MATLKTESTTEEFITDLIDLVRHCLGYAPEEVNGGDFTRPLTIGKHSHNRNYEWATVTLDGSVVVNLGNGEAPEENDPVVADKLDEIALHISHLCTHQIDNPKHVTILTADGGKFLVRTCGNRLLVHRCLTA